MDFDKDIADLNLSEVEKNGLHVFRNYKRAFERHAEQQYAKSIDEIPRDFDALRSVLSIIENDDLRYSFVIFSSYADNLLGCMFSSQLRSSGAGEAKDLLTGFGPLSSFSNKIKIASAFDAISEDICVSLHKIRNIRNKIAHSWDAKKIHGTLKGFPKEKLFDVENYLFEIEGMDHEILASLSADSKTRIRLVWVAARLEYETHHYLAAKKQRLDPISALYGKNKPNLLGTISIIARDVSMRIVHRS